MARLYDTSDLQGAISNLERWSRVVIGKRHATFGIRLVMHVVSSALHAVQGQTAAMTTGPYIRVEDDISDLRDLVVEYRNEVTELKAAIAELHRRLALVENRS